MAWVSVFALQVQNLLWVKFFKTKAVKLGTVSLSNLLQFNIHKMGI